jgi:hypothetical protein
MSPYIRWLLIGLFAVAAAIAIAGMFLGTLEVRSLLTMLMRAFTELRL